MRTIEVNIYKFSELSEKAKEKALEKYANEVEYYLADEAMDSLKGLVKHFSSELKDWHIDFSNNGHSNVKFDIPDYMHDLTGEDFRLLIASMGDFDKETLRGNGNCKFTGYGMDEDAADGVRIAYFKGERDIEKLLSAGFGSWHLAAVEDYKEQRSYESYANHCEANEYEFTEDGKMY